MTDDGTALRSKTKEPKLLTRLFGRGFRSPVLLFLFGLLIVTYWGLTLWGIASPFQWGHHGFHAGFHGSNARNLMRHNVWTPAHYSGQSPPPRSTYYLHHPILMHQYLVPGFALFGQEDWVVRMVPAMFTFLALLALFWSAGRLFHPWAALLACSAFVFLPQNLVFSHLIDHETPGLFYSLLACTAFILWMDPEARPKKLSGGGNKVERGSGRLYGITALTCLVLAGLTDWPPYLIAFIFGCYGWSRATASIRIFPKLDKFFQRGVVGTFAVFLMTIAVFYAMHRWTEFPMFYKLFLTLGAALAMSTSKAVPAAVESCPGRGEVSATTPPKEAKRIFRWVVNPETLKLAAWSMAAVTVFAFHFYYTYKVGAWPDLKNAFTVRTGGGLCETFFSNYRKYILELMFTKPMLLVGIVWTATLPVRVIRGKLPSSAVLPLAFLCGQLFHNLKFPNEINMHNYRAYYYAVFFPLALADLAFMWAGVWKRLRAKTLHWPRVRSVMLTASLAVLSFIAVFLLFNRQIRDAWPSYKLSRERGGTLSVEPYRSYRHRIRFYREVNRLTTPDTFVLYEGALHPRFEALWYLDRDYGRADRAPRDLKSAQRTAQRLFWSPRTPRRQYAVLTRLWPDLTPDERKALQKPLPPFNRPVAALLNLLNEKSVKSLEKPAQNNTVRIFHPMACVIYDGKGPDIKAYRFEARKRRGAARYFHWRDVGLVTVRDPGLERHWKNRLNAGKGKKESKAKQSKTKQNPRPEETRVSHTGERED